MLVGRSARETDGFKPDGVFGTKQQVTAMFGGVGHGVLRAGPGACRNRQFLRGGRIGRLPHKSDASAWSWYGVDLDIPPPML